MEQPEWAEHLPDLCPPSEAVDPSGRSFYRMADGQPTEESDFDSHRKKFPDKPFNVTECQALSASVFDDYQAMAKRAKVGEHQAKPIVKITLPSGSGKILKTGQNRHHWSWWRAKSFDLLRHCEPIQA